MDASHRPKPRYRAFLVHSRPGNTFPLVMEFICAYDVPVSESSIGIGAVRTPSTSRPLRQRIVALVAAYAIALAGLLAGFGGARAEAAAAAAIPGGVICHTLVPGPQQPASDPGNGHTCIDDCCVGCLMLMAALPPPPATVVGAPQAVTQRLEPLQTAVLAAGPDTKSHRSRAPPLPA